MMDRDDLDDELDFIETMYGVDRDYLLTRYNNRMVDHAIDTLISAQSETDNTDAARKFTFAGRVKTYFPWATAAEIIKEYPKPRWLIEEFIPENAIGILYGAKGVKKSFEALRIALSLALERLWEGKKVKKVFVAYIAAEGGSDMGIRLRGILQEWGVSDIPDNFCVQEIAIPFNQESAVDQLIADIGDARREVGCEKTPTFVVVDTLHWVSPGANENDSGHMGVVLSAADRLRKQLNSTVLFIHHTGRNGSTPRGSYCLEADVDFLIHAEATDGCAERLTFTIEKSRNRRIGDRYTFVSKEIALADDEDGKACGTCILELVDFTPAPTPRSNPESIKKATKNTNGVAKQALAQCSPPGLTHTQWEKSSRDLGGPTGGSFDRAKKRLLDKNEVQSDDSKHFYIVQ
jgi:hypothetical protein